MNNRALKWLGSHTGKTRKKLILAVILSVFTSICAVLFALLMRELIDAAVVQDMHLIRNFSYATVAVTLLLYVSHIWGLYIQENITVQTLSDLRSYLMYMIMRKDYAQVQSKHSGQWMNLLFSDIRIISDGAGSILPGIAGMISRLLLSFLTLVFLAPVLAVAYLIAGILILAGVSLFKGKLKGLHRDVQEKEDRLHAVLQEIIENVLIIKAFSAEKHFDSRIREVQSDYSMSRLRRRKYRLISVNLFALTFRMGYLAALIYGGYQILNGSVSYGTLTAVLHIVAQMQTPIYTLSGLLPKIYETISSTERVMESEGVPDSVQPALIHDFQSLELDHVTFSYDRDTVLRDVSLEVKKGDLIALTGISGGGKSTLFLLLLGMFAPDSGKITICADYTDLSPGAASRNLFAYVPQGNAMFTGTIKDNVVFNHEYDDEQFIKALKISDAYDFVFSLPEQAETKIGEHGTGLSEGQVQRIAIARAVYSGAPVLLLDESTSALDEITEARVLHNIHMMKNKTVLIVTHRPAALEICSRHVEICDSILTEVNHG